MSFKLLAVFVIAVSIGNLPTLNAQDRSQIVQIVDRIGKKGIEKDGVVGMSIGVSLGDEISYASGYGVANAELDVSASVETVYRIGSISKEYTAVAILLLQEDGVLDLDDPLTKFLPDYPVSKPTITLRHLLQHFWHSPI